MTAQQAAPVDALAVMDEAIREAERAIPTPMQRAGESARAIEHHLGFLHDLKLTRAAFAELIKKATKLEQKAVEQSRTTSSVFTSHLTQLRAALAGCGGAK